MATDVGRASGEYGLSHFKSIDERNDDYEDAYERNGLLGKGVFGKRSSKRWIPDHWFNILFGLNLGFSVFLILGFVLLARNRQYSALSEGPEPPYCPKAPLREAGVVRYINSRYKPEKEFRSINPNSDEAWNAWLKKYDRMFLLPKDKAIQAGLPETVDAYEDPGFAPYGLAVYHQIHCLNRLRKSYNVEKYYAGEPSAKIQFHIDHCIDMIRQSIICHGDISLLYWWNRNYSYVDDNGAKHYTDLYLDKSPEERAKGTFATWDTAAQCRDMEAINTWVAENEMDDDKYGGLIID